MPLLISAVVATLRRISWFAIAIAAAPALISAAAQAGDDTLEEVVVFARGEALIGKADAASEGAVGGADLSVRPLLRVAELLEVVPGLIAAQHSGSGKAANVAGFDPPGAEVDGRMSRRRSRGRCGWGSSISIEKVNRSTG